jgi:hypothetical protein
MAAAPALRYRADHDDRRGQKYQPQWRRSIKEQQQTPDQEAEAKQREHKTTGMQRRKERR